MCWEAEAVSGESWNVELLVLNTGVAPCYHNYAPVIRLQGTDSAVDLPLEADIRTWMPDEEFFGSWSLQLPKNMAPGEYEVMIGFPTGIEKRPALMLAIESAQTDGFYHMGRVLVTRERGE